MALLGALALILATSEIITVAEALEGFSNQGLLTVGVLFAVAAGINNTGGLDYYMQRILGAPSTPASAQLRLMAPVAFVSAFLNNTPVVAILIPIVTQWAARIKLAPGQLFIPLSFSSILGGTCTLIGTSTNLVVSGLYEERFPGKSIGIFDLSPYGVPVMFSGLAYVLIFSPWLLTGGARRKDAADEAGGKDVGTNHKGGDELVVAARVRPSSPVVGRTVAEGGLRGLPGLYLISVRRGNMLVRAVGPEFIVVSGDVLHFTGLAEKLGEVAAAYGLEPQHHDHDHDVSHDDVGLSIVGGGADGVDGHAGAAHGLVHHAVASDGEGPEGASVFRSKKGKLLRGYLSDQGPFRRRRRSTASERSDGGNSVDRERIELVAPTPSRSRAISARLIGARRTARYARSEDDPSGEGASDAGAVGSADGHSALSDDDEGGLAMAVSPGGAGGNAGEQLQPQPHLPPPGLRMARAAVRLDSALVGKMPREVGFRRRYGAAIVALVRRGEQLHGIIGQTPLLAGDVIVMQVSPASPLLDLINGSLPEPAAGEGEGGGTNGRLLNRRWSINRITGSFGSLLSIASGAEKERSEAPIEPADGADTHGVELSEVKVGCDEAAKPTEAAPAAVPDGLASLTECHANLAIVQNAGGVERDFMIAMRVARGSPIIGKTVQAAGLRGLPGLFLASIERHPEEAEAEGAAAAAARAGGAGSVEAVGDEEAPLVAAPHDPSAPPSIVVADRDDKLRVGDVLWFSGELDSVAALRRVPGLVPLEDHQLNKLKVVIADRRLVQAVLAQHSELVGHTAKDSRFRTRYDAVIIAVHRAGERVHHQIGTIRFQPGDVLLLDTGPGFMRAHGKDPAFALVSELRDSTPPRFHLLYVAGAAATAMIVLAVADVLPLFTAAMLAAGVMVATGCLTQQQVRESVNWQVIVTIATAFGLSNAMENAGVAGNLAKVVVDAAEATGTGETGLLVAIYVGTIILANIVGNNAAAALMFPVAMDAALRGGTDLLNMSFNVMLAASASFASPFGYQTNLMVYGAGGYRFIDFIRFGGPMQLWQLVVSVLVIVLGKPHVYVVWGVTGGMVLLLVFGSALSKRLGRCGT